MKMSLPNNLETSFRIKSPKINQLTMNGLDLSASVQDGCESLGILSLDLQNTSNFFDLEFQNPYPDLGRESLGILNMDQLNFNLLNLYDNSPSKSSPRPTNFNFTKTLDTAFLSTPTKYSNSSFNSNSLDLPSQIFFLTKSDNSFSSPIKSLLNNAQLMTTTSEKNHRRCLSQPLSNELIVPNQKFFWSTGKTVKTSFLTTNTCSNKLFDDDNDDLFSDSVFIEANHLAQKIADGSFFNNDAPEIGILDCTPQPEFPDFDESELDSQKKSNSETVFKSIDKMFPSKSQTDNFKIRTSRLDSASSKSRDAKDILDNLSEIFNNTHRSEDQKSEGRMLINNLVELLNDSQYIHDGEDSGHSSNLENASIEKCALDSDLSEKDVSFEPKKRLTQSCSGFKSAHQNVGRIHSLTSGTTLNDKKTAQAKKQNSTLGLKLKTKPAKAVPKKGPLIAVIPMKDMKKTNPSPNTSDKGQKKCFQIARTSTPINEPKLKPTFTSTPCNNYLKKGACKTNLTRENSFDSNNSNDERNSKKPDTSKVSKLRKMSVTKEPISTRTKIQTKPVRRNTISEGMAVNIPGRKRSNSLGKETGLMSVLPMIRQNLLKSPYYKNKSSILSEHNDKVEPAEEKRVRFKVADKSVTLKNKENLYA